MRQKGLLVQVILFFLIFGFQNLNARNIVPYPKVYKSTNHKFILSPDVKILYTEGLKEQGELLAEALSPATGWDFELKVSDKSRKKSIFLQLDKNITSGKEGYHLSVTNDRIVITGRNKAGVFYGVQTMLQMLPVTIYSKQRQKNTKWELAGVEIQDEPAFNWRGMMLDVSRYFYGKEYVKKFINMMAMYKMNVLHLHLIDDAGWRLEIKKYPKLTEIGAWRGENEERIGGFYTQEDIKEIVAYAQARNVELIPEIEIPAHTLAAIAAYPHLSCTGKKVKVQTRHSISRELYCVGKESTFEFLEDVFKEVFELFPSKYIHIGGDEARYDRWRACEHCQKRKLELGLKSEGQLQVYFNKRIQKLIGRYGKTIIGWDEIIEQDLVEKAVGMIWHRPAKAKLAVESGHDVVMALTGYCYFDVAESNAPGEVKAATWLPPIPLEKVYRFNPLPKSVAQKYYSQILGGHGCLWTDQFIHGSQLQDLVPINENRSERYLDYLTFPRMAALAEVCWTSKEQQSWEGFEQRMKTHYNRYDQAGYGYRVPLPKLVKKEKTEDGFVIELQSVVEGAEIRYTIDGIRPNIHSPIYKEPVKVKNILNFQAITVVNPRHYSLPLYFPVDYTKYRKYGQLLAEWKPKDLFEKQVVQLKMNATGKIKKNGTYHVSFWPTAGDDKLDVQSITIFKNGEKVGEDIYASNHNPESNSKAYKFQVDNYETGASFTIKANVLANSGVDSYGAVFIKQE